MTTSPSVGCHAEQRFLIIGTDAFGRVLLVVLREELTAASS